MTARLDSVCKYICERGSWRVSNLQLQKLLYMAQMVYMGRNEGARLVDTNFQAWDYGPVSPELYSKARSFGASPVEDVFPNARVFNAGDSRRVVLDEVCDALLKLSPGQLVEMTHWEKGAWAKHYVPGAKYIPIPDPDIAREYADRISAE
jgi:uncharacterized phage-associated protein